MQNSKFGYKNIDRSKITIQENFNSKPKNVDINRLLNRVKQNSAEERKRKLTLLSLVILSILVTGLIVF